jgi:hypothetical protein
MTFRSRPLLDLARGQHCTVFSSVCNNNPETTVTAHNPFGDRGMGTKCPDHDSCWACSACHDLLDGRRRVPHITPEVRASLFEMAKTRTHSLMWERGLIQVAGHVPHGTARKVKKPDRPAYVKPIKSLDHPGYSR